MKVKAYHQRWRLIAVGAVAAIIQVALADLRPQSIMPRTVVSDNESFTCGSGPFSTLSADRTTLYIPYLASRDGVGECHDISAMSVVPIDDPARTEHHIVAEKGQTICGVAATSIMSFMSYRWQDKIRVNLIVNYAKMVWRDWDPVTGKVTGEGVYKCSFGGQTWEIQPERLTQYLNSQGMTGHNVCREAGDRMVVQSKPVWIDGVLYGFVTSSYSQPILFRCSDGETLEFCGVVPAICEYECQLAYLNGRFYALMRGATGDNFFVTDAGSYVFKPAGRVPDGLQRPQLLAYDGRVLIGYSALDEEPSGVRNGRNNLHILLGEGSDLAQYREMMHIREAIGFVYPDLVDVDGELYVIWSNAERFPTMEKWGAVQGKDQLLFGKIGVLDYDNPPSEEQQEDLLRVAYADGKITVTASPNAAVDGNKSILLRYGLTPGRENGLGWEHSMVVTDELTAEGGEWTVDAAECGITEGVVAQAVAGTVIEQYEYLESDGTHYLDTGVKHVKGDAVQMDFLLAADGFNSADNFEFYGARDDVNGVAAVEAFMDPDSASGKGRFVADFRNANDAGYRITYDCPSGAYASFLCRKHLLLNLDAAGPRLTATDGSVSVRSAKGYTGSLSLSHSAYVFAVNNAGWKPAKNMRLYALTITRNGNQYREYIPTRDANGLPCLRDVVSSISPITSSGNGFTLGDSVGKVIIRPDEISVSPSIFVTSRVLAEIEDRRVLPDGEAHTVEFNISYPSSGDGCLVQWAWTDNPSDQDFIHSEPCGYREVGVYTNVVRVMDLNYALKPYVATGVVEIVPPLKLERREDGKLRIVLEPGVIEDKAPLQLGWGLSDAGDNFAAWEHLVTVDPAATAAGGEYEVDLVAAGIPEVAYCRAFAVPWIWKLDYLQADGKNYLDTGIRHQTHDVIDLRFTMDTLESGNVGIYGSRDADGDDEVSVLINTTSGAKMILDFWNNPANFGDRLTLTFGTQFAEILGRPVRVRLSQSEIYLTTEDGTYQSVRKSTPSVINCSNTAYIFGCYDWNTTHPAPPQGIKLNELTVTREGGLYRHYLPALTPGGEAGLYDTVTGEYLSKSTASFGGAETKQILPLVDPTYAGSSSLLVYGDSTAVLAVTEGAAGIAGDGVYRASVRVVYPSQGEGCRVKWAWTGAPDAEDFVHDEPCGYAAAGVYTNVVCVTDLTGTLTPYFGTGIVEVVSTVATELSADGERMTITVAPQVVEPGMAAKLVLAWGEEDRGGDYLDWEHWQMVKGDLSADGDAVEVTIGELPGEFGPFYRAFVVDAQFALLRYLESTGSEYIDLGRKISAADRVELELEFPTLPTGAFGIFGSRKTYAEACYCVNASIKDGIGTLALMVNSDGETGYGTRSAKDANISLGAHYTLIGGGGEKGVITRSEGGVTTVFTAPEATAKTFTSALNARLFDVAEEIDDTFDPSKGRVRIFSCVINGGAPPNGMNLVAARRNDGTLGMYDLVSGDFLEKAPSCQGAFVAGPETGCIGTGVVCSPAGNTSGKVVATLTDYKGFYDGEAHAIGIDISYPGFGEGCEVKWAWRGNPREQDFVHDLPGSYVEPGCYTNVVRIVDAAGTLAPFVGTGAVEIVRMVEARSVSGSKAIYARVRPQVVPQGTTARLVLWWDSEDRGEQAADWAHWAVLDDEVTAAGVEVRRACEELGIGKGDVFRVAVVSKGYDRLEYLESNKREYIEFPRKLHNADSVVLEVSFPEVPTGNFGVFGARDNYNSSAYTISANATAVSFSINSDTDYQNYAATVNHAAKVDARYVITGGNGVKTAIAEILGETTNRIEAASATAKNFVTTPSMRLFDLAEQTGDVFSPANGKARVYSLVINGGRQADGMDLIPVRRADGTLGMYDRTDGAFYGNSSGSGSFAAGPVIGFDPSIRFSTLAVSPAKVLRGRGLLIIFKGLQE